MKTLGGLQGASVIVALGLLTLISHLYDVDDLGAVLTSGVLGLLTYLVVGGLGQYFETRDVLADDDGSTSGGSGAGQVALATGKAAFFLFIYLEVLDASFSFDGVIGAFAITSDPIVIALGLGVGAFTCARSPSTLCAEGTLAEYIYLDMAPIGLSVHWPPSSLCRSRWRSRRSSPA